MLSPGHDELVLRIWSMLSEGTNFSSVVEVLTAEFGADLTSFPDFAILLREGEGGRLAVRGGFVVTVRFGDEAISVDGSELITWAERKVSRIEGWAIVGPGADEAGRLGLGAGLVRDAVIPVSRLGLGVPTPALAAAERPAEPEAEPAQEDPAPSAQPEPQEEEEPLVRTVREEEPERGGIPEEAKQFHDGLTINHALLGEERAASSAATQGPEGPATPASPQPQVLSVPCVDGHHNPPYLQSCRMCGKEMSRTLARIERPSLGRLVLSTGEVVELDRDLVFGRNPRDPLRVGRQVRLVAVGDDDQDVSRNHCEIRIEGWDARIRDLGSRNGTFLTHLGEEAERVGESSPAILRVGDLIELGNTVSMRLEC